MKFINEPILVEARNRVPQRFRWRGRIYNVQKVLDYWILQTRWWGREEKRIYFRLETDGAVMEVYRSSGFITGTPAKAPHSGASARVRHFGTSGKTRRAVPPFVEGNTHTRERRRTDFPYRPDAKDRSRRPPIRIPSIRKQELHWTLSKILD